MKTLIATLSLFVLITAQAATISTKVLGGIESRIENQKAELVSNLYSANTDDMQEGKHIASMAYLIEGKLALAEQMLASLNESDLTSEKIAEITKILDEADKLIQEI